MSYSVFRIQGVKTTGDLKGISKHNKDRVSHTNADIDKTRSNDNIILVECNNYNKKFNQIVAPMKVEHSERMENMRADRVKTFDQHINSSKNDVACEMIFTSDNDFFKNMNKQEVQKWAEESLDFVTKDLGIDKKNILHAIVHMDEKTPHLHVVTVPLVKTFNKKQKKDVWSISRRQYISGKQQLSELQDTYNKRMNDNGYKLERGEKGSEKIHTTKSEYIKEQLENLKEEVHKSKSEVVVAQGVRKNIKEDINTLEDTLKALESDFKALEGVKSNIWNIEHIEGKKSLVGSKITIKIDDYDKLVGLAKQGVYNADKVRDLKRDNERLESSSSYNGSRNTTLWNENNNLKNDILSLKKQRIAMYKVLEKNNLLQEVKKELQAPVKNLNRADGRDR